MNWIFLSLLSLILMGLGNFFFKLSANAGQGALMATLISCLAEAVLGLILVWILKPPGSFQGSAIGWPVLAGCFFGGGLLCLILAMSKPDSNTGIAVAMMNSNFLLVTALSWIFLSQSLSVKQIVGFCVVIGGLVLLI